jgi:hypothetical protein
MFFTSMSLVCLFYMKILTSMKSSDIITLAQAVNVVCHPQPYGGLVQIVIETFITRYYDF